MPSGAVKHIVCPVDFSEVSARALSYAAELSGCLNADLTVMYSDTFSPPPYFTESKLDELKQQFEDAFSGVGQELRRFVGRVLPSVPGKLAIRVVEALPADGIQKVAREVGADLIVMGSHGRSGIRRLLLGSVTERILRESEVPVLVVKEKHVNP
jgi:nucleotide-binding universal stress UspA family protein